jgi:hypothetical protein
MANDLKDTPLSGGISFKTPVFSFGNTVPDINSGFSFDLPLSAIQAFSDQALNFSANNTQNTQAFLANQISTTQGQVTATAGQTAQTQSQSLSTLNSIASKISNILQPQGGCFITTAICEELGLPDDCYYLETLRDFRDNVMLTNPKWKLLVEQYYKIAPGLVEKINRRADKEECYQMMRDDYLVPAISLIEKKEHTLAIQLYREMVIFAQVLADEVELSGA